LIIAQYSIDLVPIFLRDRNLLLLLLLLLLWLLFLVSLKAAMIFLPIVGHAKVTSVTRVTSCTPIRGLVIPRQTFVVGGQKALDEARDRQVVLIRAARSQSPRNRPKLASTFSVGFSLR
jgi:hypothetical protein